MDKVQKPGDSVISHRQTFLGASFPVCRHLQPSCQKATLWNRTEWPKPTELHWTKFLTALKCLSCWVKSSHGTVWRVAMARCGECTHSQPSSLTGNRGTVGNHYSLTFSFAISLLILSGSSFLLAAKTGWICGIVEAWLAVAHKARCDSRRVRCEFRVAPGIPERSPPLAGKLALLVGEDADAAVIRRPGFR
jgi:hypothetical protein